MKGEHAASVSTALISSWGQSRGVMTALFFIFCESRGTTCCEKNNNKIKTKPKNWPVKNQAAPRDVEKSGILYSSPCSNPVLCKVWPQAASLRFCGLDNCWIQFLCGHCRWYSWQKGISLRKGLWHKWGWQGQSSFSSVRLEIFALPG